MTRFRFGLVWVSAITCWAIAEKTVLADTFREEQLRTATNQLMLAQEERFEEATQKLLRKHCPKQFEEITDTIAQISQERPTISWAGLMAIRDGWIHEALQKCDKRQQVDHWTQRFNEEVANQALVILENIRSYLNNETNAQASEAQLEGMSQLLLTTLIDTHLDTEKLLARVLLQVSEGEFPSRPTQTTCKLCKRSTHLLIQCRCKDSFCAKHKSPEKHSCTFNYRQAGREEIEQNNPHVIGDSLGGRI